MLLALQSGGKRAAPELARELEVSTRTIYRDIDALSAAGVPVYAERGATGGIVLADSYRDALARFDERELRALFVSSDDVLADVGLVGQRSSALSKLAASLPRGARSALERDRGRVHVDQRGWFGSSQKAPTLTVLRDAVWDDRRLAIGYRDRNGALTRRRIDPLGLVAKAGIWYLVARDGDAIKSFRVQRIVRARMLAERFDRPDGFDVGEYWKRSSAAFGAQSEERAIVTFRMTERALANAQTYLDVISHERITGMRPRVSLVRIAFANDEVALREAFGYNEEAVVVDPPALRERLLERARALAARYDAPA